MATFPLACGQNWMSVGEHAENIKNEARRMATQEHVLASTEGRGTTETRNVFS
jgi:hypothetical protein